MSFYEDASQSMQEKNIRIYRKRREVDGIERKKKR